MSRIETTVVIRPCQSHDDLKVCVDLQRRVWNFSDEDLVPTGMLVVAQHTGGQAYCAFDGDKAVGFALAFAADRDGHRYWHSHMVAVIPEYQNRGIGRMLKLHQRDEALRMGISEIEWTFDPLEPRNAHFNIARLGVIARHYIPDCYGTTTSPLHGSLPTDRLVAEWMLDSSRVRSILNGAEARIGAGAIAIEIPADASLLKTAQFQSELRGKLTDLFARGFAITGFRRGGKEYLLEPYED